MKIFAKPVCKTNYFEKLSDDATRPLQRPEEVEAVKKQIKKKLEDFTVKIFGNQQQNTS